MLPMLTPREKEAAQLAADGLKDKQIADRMGITQRTVEAHLRSARIALEANNTTHLVAIIIRNGIICSLAALSALSSISFDTVRPPQRNPVPRSACRYSRNARVNKRTGKNDA